MTEASHCARESQFQCVRHKDGSALIRALADDEIRTGEVGCFHYTENVGECGETPCFRVSTPHGHFDCCGDHVDGLIASLPAEMA